MPVPERGIISRGCGDAYAITFTGGMWAARRHDAPVKILTADTALELGGLMRDDHARRPRP